ncbi:uncharacterized protein LOC144001491 isoform X2 [Festucalex cinctus]
MAAPVALVQGASRGLGLQFCKHILKNKPSASVIATCRNPDGAVQLQGLAGQHPERLTVLQLDVNREEDIREAAESVKESFGHLDLMVNSSALLHPSGKGETSLRDVSAHGIIATLATNTVGPLVMAKYFAPLLQKGGGGFGRQPTDKAKRHSGIIVNVTAKVGSIGDNGGVCFLASRNIRHGLVKAVSQKRTRGETVQHRTFCGVPDGHRRSAGCGKDGQSLQLGWDSTALVEKKKKDL